MRRRCIIGSAFLLVLSSACAESPAPETDQSSVQSQTQALTSPQHLHHADDDHAAEHAAEDEPDARAEAAERVAFRGPDCRTPVALKILGFNDFHGQLVEGRRVANRPVGGAAVLAAYLNAASAGKEKNTLIVHAGDHVGASPPESALLQDEPSIQFLNLLASKHCRGPSEGSPRCNVVGTPGNHEFDEGKDELLRLIQGGNHANGPFIEKRYRGARFPYVSSNVVVQKTKKPLLPPYVIREVGGVRVGVIGAVLKETPTIVTPTGVAGLEFRDEASSINEQVRKLKRQGVRTIIVAIHQGAPQNPTYVGPTDPAASVGSPISAIVSRLDDEVDVVISGHSHAFTNALIPTASGHPILVTQAFSAGTAYDDIDLVVDPRSGDVTSKSASIVTTYADAAPGDVRDPEVQALVDRAVSLTAPLVNRPVASLAADITRAQSPAGESALGNLIADAQRAATGTDFAFMNPGGIRADLLFAATATNPVDSDGQALWGELFVVQPFGNSLVSMKLTGQQVYDLLNQQFAVSRTLQISGLDYTWDAALPANARVVEIRTDGVAIDRTATYSVTVNNFLATGGDGFSVLTGGTDQVGGEIDLDALITFLQAAPQPVAAPALGRITRLH